MAGNPYKDKEGHFTTKENDGGECKHTTGGETVHGKDNGDKTFTTGGERRPLNDAGEVVDEVFDDDYDEEFDEYDETSPEAMKKAGVDVNDKREVAEYLGATLGLDREDQQKVLKKMGFKEDFDDEDDDDLDFNDEEIEAQKLADAKEKVEKEFPNKVSPEAKEKMKEVSEILDDEDLAKQAEEKLEEFKKKNDNSYKNLVDYLFSKKFKSQEEANADEEYNKLYSQYEEDRENWSSADSFIRNHKLKKLGGSWTGPDEDMRNNVKKALGIKARPTNPSKKDVKPDGGDKVSGKTGYQRGNWYIIDGGNQWYIKDPDSDWTYSGAFSTDEEAEQFINDHEDELKAEYEKKQHDKNSINKR